MKWRKTAVITGIFIIVVAAGIVFYFVFFTTPRMRVQENIRAFEAVMPTAPPASVPLEQTAVIPDVLFHPDRLKPPLEATPDNINKGRVYYGYYCLFCHGEKGDGEGPVGLSYMPAPPDLRTEKVQTMNNTDLLRASLLGTGHEPVINRVVPPEGYAPLLLYIRTLTRQSGQMN